MATELKEASIRVVLNTKDAIAQAEKYGEHEEEARRKGAERDRRETGPRSGGTAPGRGGGGNGDAGGGATDGGSAIPGFLWSAGKAAWNGGVSGHVDAIRRSIPVVGPVTTFADAIAEYGPAAGHALSRALGPDNPLGRVVETLVADVTEMRVWRDRVKAKLEAIDGAVDDTKGAILAQSMLFGGQVDVKATAAFAHRAYRVNEAIATGRMKRRLFEQVAAGDALGYLPEEMIDALSEATRLSAGR